MIFRLDHLRALVYQEVVYRLAKISRFYTKDLSENGVSFQNDACSDELWISVDQMEPIVSGLKLNYKGCALMKAAVNSLCLEIENKTRREALTIIKNYLLMLRGFEYEEKLIGKNLQVLKAFKRSPTRKKCLTLGANSLLKVLGGEL